MNLPAVAGLLFPLRRHRPVVLTWCAYASQGMRRGRTSAKLNMNVVTAARVAKIMVAPMPALVVVACNETQMPTGTIRR